MPPAAVHVKPFATAAEAARRLHALRTVHGPRLRVAAEAFPPPARFTHLENLQLLRDALPPERRVDDATLIARLDACQLDPDTFPGQATESPLARLTFLALRAAVDPEAVVVVDLATQGQALLDAKAPLSLRSALRAALFSTQTTSPFRLSGEPAAAPGALPPLKQLADALTPLADQCRRLLIFTLAAPSGRPLPTP